MPLQCEYPVQKPGNLQTEMGVHAYMPVQTSNDREGLATSSRVYLVCNNTCGMVNKLGAKIRRDSQISYIIIMTLSEHNRLKSLQMQIDFCW